MTRIEELREQRATWLRENPGNFLEPNDPRDGARWSLAFPDEADELAELAEDEQVPDLSFAQLPTTLEINRRPLIITAPGDYRTRDGRRVTIREIVPYVPGPNAGFLRHEVTAFEAKGSVWKVFRGKPYLRGFNVWHLSGANKGLTKNPLDIVGRWED